jgi:hypothetical protein
VKTEFDGMSHDFDGKLGETVQRISKVATALLDEESGELTQALKQFATQLDDLLDETFDEDSKKSALAKLDRLLAEATKRHVEAVKRVIDPNVSDDGVGPLGSW